ncbi:hypothetical protein HJC23_013879 [Cyclotella cryptica]|uniref:SLC26A/SulP transporter domain-containing protein n=1 Tax=Cyclotella cryptica TaxID=29204 RepID=A0ABD3QHW6_9STRA|eukprot:CCRYP_005475-RB/>CCRYP_005475-RB protein AED:0.04 eAED:0.04 QI:112/1/1/1/1/1/3/232/493
MKLFNLQLVLLYACQISAFTTHVGHRASVRAKLAPPPPPLHFSPTLTRQHVSAVRMVGVPADTASAQTADKSSLVQDMLAGLTVAFSLLSKAIACSAIVGVNPLVGLWSSVVMGLTAPLLGAREGVISGTAAVVVVPLSALTQTYGVEYMTLCILVAAVMQGLFGMFRLAKTADLVSEQVLSGFLNGLGLILLLSQASVFKAAATAGALIPAVSMSSLCFAIVQLLPRFTKAVPSSLVGLIVATYLGAALKLPLATLASSAAEGTFSGGLSALPSLVDLGLLQNQLKSPAALKLVLPAAISIMIIALVETLLAGKVVDDMTGKQQEEDVPTRSVLAMSSGNILSSLLGGFGGCGLIPQTVLNLKSGGGGAFSSISYAVAMGLFVVAFAPLVGQISQAALAGIMVTVAYDTVAWSSSAKAIKAVLNPSKYPGNDGKSVSRSERVIDLLALGISSWICYFGNLAVGIVAGVGFQRGALSILRRLVSKDGGKIEAV